MLESENSAYVRRLLDQAREEGQWYCGQPDAAALCFDVLATFPGNREAAQLVQELFRDEWLIYDNRNAIQQNIDEWDDRPWQQRRRLALSFRFMSRWEDRYGDDTIAEERDGPADVADLLRQGKMQLLHAYCLGDDECTNFAWPAFVEAFRRAQDPRRTLLWVGRQYADLGFFADAAEVLSELCSRFDDAPGRRLLAEVLWWRDNGHRLPWLPPPGDGSRYRRMMSFIDPEACDDDQMIEQMRSEVASHEIEVPHWAPSISEELTNLVVSAIAELSQELDKDKPLVDWSFLDADDGHPGELPEWARKMLRRFPGRVPEDMIHRFRWSRPIPRPTTEPRRNPDDELFDLDIDLGELEFDDDLDIDDLDLDDLDGDGDTEL